MNTWCAEVFGNPMDVLKVKEVDIPVLTAGTVLVRVLATGVGLPDVLMCKGLYPLVKNPPAFPGQELVGEVVAVLDDAKFSVGDRIMGTSNLVQAGFSEYCLMQEDAVCIVPDTLSNEQAAGFVIPFKTAYTALVLRTKLQPGESLLVLGAAGSSGQAAIQLGKCLGATVIAVASSANKLDFCKELGADHVISYRDCNMAETVNSITEGKGVDVVFDPVGGELSESSDKCIATHGRIGLVGFASGSWPIFEPVSMVMKNYSTLGVFAGNLSDIENSICFDTICEYASRGLLKTPVARVFDFHESALALEMLEKTPPCGKFIIRGKL